jgi:F1F0 ATPase subunit 2
MTVIDLREAAFYLAAGAVLGTAYFVLLLRAVRAHAGQGAAGRLISLYLLRLALAGSAFWMIVQQGAAPLLLAVLGFVLARTAVQHRIGRE